MEAPSADLMAQWREGDQKAAGELFQRYAERLLALARSRLSPLLARHVDPEDVVQSAYRSFFAGAASGRFALQRSGDLWRLLVAITLHKLQHQLEHHTAAKRAVFRIAPREGGESLIRLSEEVLAHEPTPVEAAALAETLERVFRGLAPVERRMVEMRLQGYTLDEIAQDLERSERTVRRILERVKVKLLGECEDITSS